MTRGSSLFGTVALTVSVITAACGGGAAAPASSAPGATAPVAPSAATSTSAPAPQEVTIGALLPLTGSAAVVAGNARNGAQLAVDDINKAGTVPGVRLKLVVEDDGFQPTVGVNAVNKLLTSDKPVAIVGSTISAVTLAVLDRIQDAKTPLLTGALSPDVTKKGNPYVFRIRTSDAVSARELTLYAINDAKVTGPGVIYEQSDYGQGGFATLDSTIKELGLQWKAVQTFNPSDQSLTAQVAKMKDANVGAIFYWGSQPQAALLVKEMKQQGLKAQVFGNNAYADKYVIDLAAGAADGVICAVNFLPEASDAATSTFVKAYKDKYGQTPDGYAAAFWDAVRLVADAIKASGPDREKVAAALRQVKSYRGISADFEYREGGEMAKGQLIVKIASGAPQVIARR